MEQSITKTFSLSFALKTVHEIVVITVSSCIKLQFSLHTFSHFVFVIFVFKITSKIEKTRQTLGPVMENRCLNIHRLTDRLTFITFARLATIKIFFLLVFPLLSGGGWHKIIITFNRSDCLNGSQENSLLV